MLRSNSNQSQHAHQLNARQALQPQRLLSSSINILSTIKLMILELIRISWPLKSIFKKWKRNSANGISQRKRTDQNIQLTIQFQTSEQTTIWIQLRRVSNKLRKVSRKSGLLPRTNSFNPQLIFILKNQLNQPLTQFMDLVAAPLTTLMVH